MSNEIAVHDENQLELLPPAQPPSLAARQMLAGHAEMMQTAYELAQAMCATTMVPVRFQNKPQDGAAAILYGAELGLNPIQSLQRIISIHGMPTLEARTMVALLKSRGYKIKTVAQSDDSVTVAGVDLDGEQYESTWTMQRVIKAGYVPTVDEKTGKYKTNTHGKLIGNEKYLTDPQAMLKSKAQAEVCRDMAPDILIGISYSTEELQSERFNANHPVPYTPSVGPLTVEELFDQPTESRRSAPDESPADIPGQRQDQDPQAFAESPDLSEPAAAPPPKPAGMSEATRRKWLNRMFQLLQTAECGEREDQLIILALLASRPGLEHRDGLTDAELKYVVNELNKWDKAGVLGQRITDLLNEDALAEESIRAEEQQ